MPLEFALNDVQLTAGDIRRLENADAVATLFAGLGYITHQRRVIGDYALLGLDAADLKQQITRLELIGSDPIDADIKVRVSRLMGNYAELD